MVIIKTTERILVSCPYRRNGQFQNLVYHIITTAKMVHTSLDCSVLLIGKSVATHKVNKSMKLWWTSVKLKEELWSQNMQPWIKILAWILQSYEDGSVQVSVQCWIQLLLVIDKEQTTAPNVYVFIQTEFPQHKYLVLIQTEVLRGGASITEGGAMIAI